MPIIRKVIKVKDSKLLTIPKSWLDFYEREAGVEIHELALEVNRVLKVTPIFSRTKLKEKKNAGK